MVVITFFLRKYIICQASLHTLKIYWYCSNNRMWQHGIHFCFNNFLHYNEIIRSGNRQMISYTVTMRKRSNKVQKLLPIDSSGHVSFLFYFCNDTGVAFWNAAGQQQIKKLSLHIDATTFLTYQLQRNMETSLASTQRIVLGSRLFRLICDMGIQQEQHNYSLHNYPWHPA